MKYKDMEGTRHDMIRGTVYFIIRYLGRTTKFRYQDSRARGPELYARPTKYKAVS